MIKSKKCSRCKLEKNADQFRVRSRIRLRQDGSTYLSQYLYYQCKQCDTNYFRHHLTREQYENMLAKRAGNCWNIFCNNKATVIDHDHSCCSGDVSCGKCVTGLLCNGCNSAEGHLESNTNKALGLAAYIAATRPGIEKL